MGYKLLSTRYSGLEYLFPPLNGTCNARHHIETTKEFERSGTSDLEGIPASPAMALEIRRQASRVARYFSSLDAHPHARAVRDILFNDYVEHVIARVLGPERVLWFLRECMVLSGHVYYRASTNEEMHWRELWKGWNPPMRSKSSDTGGDGSVSGNKKDGSRGRDGERKERRKNVLDDSDDSLSGNYVEPTSPEHEEPPSLTKIGEQFWHVPAIPEK